MRDIKREELAYFRSRPTLIETLTILIEDGPCQPGDLLHTDHTRELLIGGYATGVVVKLDDGWYAATLRGRDMYLRLYHTTLGGLPDTVREAYANRKAVDALKRVSAPDE